MERYRILFDELEWQEAIPGARFKARHEGERQFRLLELTSEFVEPEWCEKGHAGIVLQGELEIDFRGRQVRYPQGAALHIPAGPGSAHKARSMAPVTQLFLIEDI